MNPLTFKARIVQQAETIFTTKDNPEDPSLLKSRLRPRPRARQRPRLRKRNMHFAMLMDCADGHVYVDVNVAVHVDAVVYAF